MTNSSKILSLGIPKGKMFDGVTDLLSASGIFIRGGERDYRPTISLKECEVKILKPQNILKMLHTGSRDIGFAGLDWVYELKADVEELMDTSLNPVKIVVAAHKSVLVNGELPKDRRLIIASEYESLSRSWIEKKNLNATFVKSYGATEVFPPEDADCIIDNTATGSTLKANNLEVIDTIMSSSTRLFAHPKVLDDKAKRKKIESLVMLLRSVLDARERVMVELNVSASDLEAVISILPSMRQPTLAKLHEEKGKEQGFSLRSAVIANSLVDLIPLLKSKGARDIIVTKPSQIVL